MASKSFPIKKLNLKNIMNVVPSLLFDSIHDGMSIIHVFLLS